MNLQELPEGKIWKYAKPELERRFLLPAAPEFLKDCPVKVITDRYLLNTRLRARKTFDGVSDTYKLTKKLPLQVNEISKQWISTIYLSRGEYDLFMKLPGNMIEKKRYYFEEMKGERIAIDEMILNKETLYLAEIEFETEASMTQYEFPFDFEKEVTNNKEFAGNELAQSYSS